MNVNDEYGWWTVTDLVIYNGRKCAKCVCRCGIEKIILRSNLINGNTTKCKDCSYKNRGPLLAKRIHGEHLAAKDKWSDYQVKARQRKIAWDLSFEDFLTFTKQNCYYCGEEPSNVNRIPEKEWALDFTYNGLDRFDNTIGYTFDNIVACCKYCNYMKRELTVEEFYRRIEKIYITRTKC